MRELSPDFSQGGYDRPQQRWVCGLSEDGAACPAGPTAGGRCPALAHCAPIRDGDRWRCNRSEVRGGPCDDGPRPDGTCSCIDRCQPVRSLRSRRGRFVVAAVLLTVGTAMMALSSDHREEVLVPGRLAMNHAQILAGKQGVARCATCHDAADAPAGEWLVASVVRRDNVTKQSQLCLDCHDKTLNADKALLAHNVSPERLREITAGHSRREQPALRLISGGPTYADELACATCHQEHQGPHHDLTAMRNNRCQACHTQQYHSFASDHPDFSIWPYQRRTRIAFDHAAHSQKHFPTKNQTFDCATCHVDGPDQSVKLLASYEQSCAACHDDQIAASTVRGVDFFALPMIDTDAIRDAGLADVEWPELATGEFDGRLPPAMKLLLSADPRAAEAFEQLGAGFEFADIDADRQGDLVAAVELIRAIKQLLAELSADPRTTLRARLRVALGATLSERDLDALASGLAADTVAAAAATWLPDLAGHTSPADSAETSTSSATSQVTMLDPQLALAPAGGWTRDDATFAIRYRAAGHADPLLAAWLALVADAADADPHGMPRALLKELTQATAAGQCATCHSVERDPSAGLLVNWLAYDRTTEPRGFTRFAHRPHLIQPQLADCTHCHQIDDQSNSAASYSSYDPHQFATDFLPMSKTQCAECHTPQAAGDRCTTCHNYHVEE